MTSPELAAAPPFLPGHLDHVTSSDGTRIAVESRGRGPHLLVVPGALSDRHTWAAVASLLAPRLTVSVMDRRGRGDSGDAPSYTPEQEVDDVVAVLDDLGGPAHLLGQSSGGVLALRVAERGHANVDRLAVYEPAVAGPGLMPPLPATLMPELRARLAAGDRDGALRAILRVTMHLGDAEIDGMARDPYWPALLALAPTTIYDLEVVAAYRPDRRRLGVWSRPVLLLAGSETPADDRAPVAALERWLPDARATTLAGQGHIANVMAPQLVAEVLLGFLLDRR
jgi:pimeloyl-ACP methyl ester carboxylesterase